MAFKQNISNKDHVVTLIHQLNNEIYNTKETSTSMKTLNIRNIWNKEIYKQIYLCNLSCHKC